MGPPPEGQNPECLGRDDPHPIQFVSGRSNVPPGSWEYIFLNNEKFTVTVHEKIPNNKGN